MKKTREILEDASLNPSFELDLGDEQGTITLYPYSYELLHTGSNMVFIILHNKPSPYYFTMAVLRYDNELSEFRQIDFISAFDGDEFAQMPEHLEFFEMKIIRSPAKSKTAINRFRRDWSANMLTGAYKKLLREHELNPLHYLRLLDRLDKSGHLSALAEFIFYFKKFTEALNLGASGTADTVELPPDGYISLGEITTPILSKEETGGTPFLRIGDMLQIAYCTKRESYILLLYNSTTGARVPLTAGDLQEITLLVVKVFHSNKLGILGKSDTRISQPISEQDTQILRQILQYRS